MTRLGLTLVLITASAAAAATRIYTNPSPEDELRKLFPAAASFSPLAGDPLHFTVYGAGSRNASPPPTIGYAFWTTDMVPAEVGYHGPIHILVGMDLAGVLAGIVVDYHSEPYGYFSVEPPEFARQFTGKSVRDPFRVGTDIDAVSRASISINSAARAVRESARMMARRFLTPKAVQ